MTDRYEICTITYIDPLDRADRQNYRILNMKKLNMMAAIAILTNKNRKISGLLILIKQQIL